MLGADLRYLTFLHVIEDIFGEYFPIDPYLEKIYVMNVIDSSGTQKIVKTHCHNPLKSIDREAGRLLPYFLKYNAIKHYPIGESEISLLDAKKVVFSYHMALLDGVSIYGKFRLTKKLQLKIYEQIEALKSI
jgi:hypothetical protein